MDTSRLTYLLEGYAARSLTRAEEAELLALLNDDSLQVAEEIMARMDAYSQQPYVVAPATLQPAINQVLAVDKPATVIRPLRSWRWVAAAVTLLIAATAGYFFLHRPAPPPKSAYADIAPGGSKATLTLADGTTIPLDSNGNQVITQGNTRVQQSPGSLSYTSGNTTDAIAYNTLRTPRGGKFQLRLPDGTSVWINAASSLKYPVAFNKNERTVEVSGEAYFEIAPDMNAPFIVKVSDGSSVEVLGTQFNITAYPDDHHSATTLLEGAVRVRFGQNNMVLQPGQQAAITASGNININRQINTDRVIAWKNGLFNFEGASLQEVMKELERWYDIEVVYEKGIPDLHFGGEMSRNLQLSEVLRGLQDANVHFRLEQGRRLVIMP